MTVVKGSGTMISAKQARYMVAESVGERNRQIAAQEWLKNKIEPLIIQTSKKATSSIRIKIPDEFGRTAMNLLTDLGYTVNYLGEEDINGELKIKCNIRW